MRRFQHHSRRDLLKRSTHEIVEEVCDCLGRGPVYASVDIDVLDPIFVPATGHLR